MERNARAAQLQTRRSRRCLEAAGDPDGQALPPAPAGTAPGPEASRSGSGMLREGGGRSPESHPRPPAPSLAGTNAPRAGDILGEGRARRPRSWRGLGDALPRVITPGQDLPPASAATPPVPESRGRGGPGRSGAGGGLGDARCERGGGRRSATIRPRPGTSAPVHGPGLGRRVSRPRNGRVGEGGADHHQGLPADPAAPVPEEASAILIGGV